MVRKPRALHWLKTSNILYADIHIEDGNITCDDNDNNNDNNNDINDEDDDENDDDDENNDDNTTTNEEDEQQQQQEGTVNGPPQLESSVVRTDPNMEAVDIVRNGDFNYPVYRLPRVEGQPISLFTDAKAEEMAFPCLFPNGVNGFLTARDPAINITA